jgi:hypothetical protein
MKLKITYAREFCVCFAKTTLDSGDEITAAGQSWEEAKANLIDKVRMETGFASNVPPDEEIEIEGKLAEETGSLFSKQADAQFEHPSKEKGEHFQSPEDYRIAIPPPEQTEEKINE